MTNVLQDKLDRRLELLASLRSLAVAQRDIIEARKTDELLRLLAQRETLTNQLVSDQSEFDEAAAAWKASGRPENAGLTTRLDTAEAILKEILDLDARDEAAIRDACGKITEDIKEVTTQTVARNAYHARPHVGSSRSDTSRFTDASG